MEPNHVHVVAPAVLRQVQQVIDAVKPGFTGQIVGHVGEGDRLNRIHDDVAVVHPVAAADFHVGSRPDANAAPDSAAPNSFAKALGKLHIPYANRSLSRLERGPALGARVRADGQTRQSPRHVRG